MKYVQINSFYNGSTGNIMRKKHEELLSQGNDSYIFWGRRHKTISKREVCFTSKWSVYLHGLLSRITDKVGFYSRKDTERLIQYLEKINPDVVHLHNLHGYYINIELLFSWLANHRCQVKWTLHDCWPFTGHCAHFSFVKCSKWKKVCFNCPQKTIYPKSYVMDSSRFNFENKKRLFNLISKERMTLITPSKWLANLLKSSFLKDYSVEVIPNTIDTNIFKPIKSDFRKVYNLQNKFIILGVASPWSKRKGLDDFIQLAENIKDTRKIVLVGLNKKQLRTLPENILGLKSIRNKKELVKIYSSADVFFNPTLEDNFPTVNLEAESCGTPVVTYDTGGSAETIGNPLSAVIEVNSSRIENSCSAFNAIELCKNKKL